MVKRGNNEGSIFQLANGKWRAQVFSHGSRLSHMTETKAQASAWVRSKLVEIDSGMDCSYAKYKLKDFIDNWLTGIQSSLKPTTFYQYEMTVRKHICPTLGNIKVVDLRSEHVQHLYTARLNAGIGVRTVEFIHGVLHKCLDHALKLGVIMRNPCDAVSKPRMADKEMSFFSEDEVNQFLLAAQGTREEALYLMAIATGMRQSELLALKWSDLDWERRTLNVQRQLKRKRHDKNYFDPPKTSNGRRTVVLGDRTIEKLREHQQRQWLERKAMGDQWEENDLIFPSTIGSPMDQSNLYTRFTALLRASGLRRIRFHDLRHTAASLMLNYGVSPIVVSRRLGHSKVSITLDVYGHLIPEMQNQAAELIDDLIIPAPIPLHTVAHGCTQIAHEAENGEKHTPTGDKKRTFP